MPVTCLSIVCCHFMEFSNTKNDTKLLRQKKHLLNLKGQTRFRTRTNLIFHATTLVTLLASKHFSISATADCLFTWIATKSHHHINTATVIHLLIIEFCISPHQLNNMLVMGLDKTLIGQQKIAVNHTRKLHYI